jgi:hypothetical protein
VVSEAGIKGANTRIHYNNNVRADQISGTGDALHYSVYHSAVAATPDADYPASGSTATVRSVLPSATGWLTELDAAVPFAAPRDGAYHVQVRSHAPTGSGYAPSKNDGYEVELNKLDYSVVTRGGYTGVGEASGTQPFTGVPKLAFAPLLDVLPEALNWNGTAYVAEPSAKSNITINALKRFRLGWQNNSATQSNSTPTELGLLLDASAPNVTWSNANVEATQVGAATLALPLDTNAADNTTTFGFNPTLWKTISTLVSGVPAASNNTWLRISAVPTLAAGQTAPRSFSTVFQSFVGYKVGTIPVRHKGQPLNGLLSNNLCGNGNIDSGETCDNCPADLGVCGDDGGSTSSGGTSSGGSTSTSSSGGSTSSGGTSSGSTSSGGTSSGGTSSGGGGNCNYNGIRDAGESCDSCSDVPACTDPTLYNSGIEIVGTARSEQGITTNLDSGSFAQSVGDLHRAEIHTNLKKNIEALLARSDVNCVGGGTLQSAGPTGGWNRSGGGCYLQDGKILLYDTHGGNDIYLGNGSGDTVTLPEGVNTLVVRGANLHIRGNLEYPNKDSSFGVVVLRDTDEPDLMKTGNLLLYPNVTNVVGAYYAEGSLMSVNTKGKPLEDTGNRCNGQKGFCDRSQELHNQLYWQGLLATSNTIGGSDKDPVECPTELTAWCPAYAAAQNIALRDLARVFDFNYLRTFHALSTGTRASGIPNGEQNNYAVYFEYDGRVLSNPPPLFGDVTGAGSSTLGY